MAPRRESTAGRCDPRLARCAIPRLFEPVRSRVHSWWEETGWDRFVRVLAGVGFLGGILLFLLLALNAPKGTYLEIELQLMRALRHEGVGIGPHWFADAMRDLTALGSAIVLILLTLMILGYLAMRRHYRIAVLIAASIGGGEIINAILKETFDRARPDATLHLVEVKTSSFPSGHAMAASIFYLTVGALLARTAERRREKSYLIATALLLTVLTAFSRVYLGVHYPTDVLAGCAAGTSWALLCWFVADWLARRGSLREEVEPVQR